MALKPVIKTIFPSWISAPFGELVVFTIILSSVTEFKKSKKVSFISVLVAGGFLIMGSLLVLVTLGVDVYGEYELPPIKCFEKGSDRTFY